MILTVWQIYSSRWFFVPAIIGILSAIAIYKLIEKEMNDKQIYFSILCGIEMWLVSNVFISYLYFQKIVFDFVFFMDTIVPFVMVGVVAILVWRDEHVSS